MTKALILDGMRELLLKYDARHVDGCPQAQQNYWRMRPEYRSMAAMGGQDVTEKPCTCGLDALLGQPDDRRQG